MLKVEALWIPVGTVVWKGDSVKNEKDPLMRGVAISKEEEDGEGKLTIEWENGTTEYYLYNSPLKVGSYNKESIIRTDDIWT